jgi:hypothetical protein
MALTAAGAAVISRKNRLTVRLDPRHDVVGLLRGALQHPEAFREVPAVFHRPLIPRLGAEATSLAVAWTAAAAGRLYCTWTRTPLARRAADHHALVLDGRREEARVVASALGAMDLDAWDAALARGRTSRLVEQVNAHLRRCGETWSVRLAPVAAGPPAVLDWPARRRFASREPGGRVITLVDETSPWMADVLADGASRPARAALALLDRLLDLVELPEARRAALLAPLARAAVEEAAR